MVLVMAKAARVLAALKRDGWTETRRSCSHRVLAKGQQQRIWAYHDGVDLGGPAMAKIARDYAVQSVPLPFGPLTPCVRMSGCATGWLEGTRLLAR